MASEIASQFSIEEQIPSREEKMQKEFLRIATNVHTAWKEVADLNTRLFLKDLFPPLFTRVNVRRSVGNQGSSNEYLYSEYLVPIHLIHGECYNMFSRGKTIEDVAIFIRRFLRWAPITTDQKHKIEVECNLRERMPDGWSFEGGDVFVRLRLANIEFDEDWSKENSRPEGTIKEQAVELLCGQMPLGVPYDCDNAVIAAEILAMAQKVDVPYYDPRAYATALAALKSTGSLSEAIEAVQGIMAEAADSENAAL